MRSMSLIQLFEIERAERLAVLHPAHDRPSAGPSLRAGGGDREGYGLCLVPDSSGLDLGRS
jgi:hypothetical protein